MGSAEQESYAIPELLGTSQAVMDDFETALLQDGETENRSSQPTVAKKILTAIKIGVPVAAIIGSLTLLSSRSEPTPVLAADPPTQSSFAQADCDPNAVKAQTGSTVRIHITESKSTPIDPDQLGTITKITNPDGKTLTIGTTQPKQPYTPIALNSYAMTNTGVMHLNPGTEYVISVFDPREERLATTVVKAEENCHSYTPGDGVVKSNDSNSVAKYNVNEFTDVPNSVQVQQTAEAFINSSRQE